MAGRERIRVVHHVWRLSASGGIPIVVRQILNGLDPCRFEQHVLSHRPLYDTDDLQSVSPDVTMHSLGIEGRASPTTRLKAAVRLRQTLAMLRPDLVHTHSGIASNLLPWRLIDLARTPAILEVHDDAASGRVSQRTNQLESFAIRSLKFEPLAHSRAVADDIARRTGRRTEPVPLGIDVAAFATPKGFGQLWRASHSIADDAIVVLYVARIVPSKNIPLFLDVTREVMSTRSQTCFVLVGGGDLEAAREAAAVRGLGSPGLRILGFEPDLLPCYAAADAFLSTSSYEGFGIALVEAMAAGLPVLSTAVGGTVDVVVDGETGRLVEPSNPRTLAKAVIELVDDPVLRRTWGEAGRRRAAKRFDVGRFVDDMARLYEDLVRR